jgi:type I restriction enzyme S subunit
MQKLFSQEIRFKPAPSEVEGDEYPAWVEKKVGEIIGIKSEKYNPACDRNKIKCVELEHIESGTGRLIGFTDAIDTISIKSKFIKGDVLFGKLRPYLRKYIIAPFDGVCSSEIWVMKSEKLTNVFLYYYIQSDSFAELSNKSSGSKMPRADWNILSSSVLYFPCHREQTKIANFLSAIDEKINHCQTQIEKTEQWKKGLLQRMFC